MTTVVISDDVAVLVKLKAMYPLDKRRDEQVAEFRILICKKA